ncbi:hypothetical protein OPQ81_003052 [Rhizoctonia solani]|nr:hypothetical protein OPQ81_003052 [Rhizoctonia solani]
MPSPSKIIAPLKDAVKRNKGDSGEPAEGFNPQLPAAGELVARDYVTVHPPSPDSPPQVVPEPGSLAQPAPTASDYEAVSPTTPQNRGRVSEAGHVTEVTLAPSVTTAEHKKMAVLRSNGQGGQGLETEVFDVDSDGETDSDEPWTYLNQPDATGGTTGTTTTSEYLPSVENQPSPHPYQPPTYLSARVAAWIIPKLPPAPIGPPHKFKISTFRLAGQRLYVSTYPFYAPFFRDLAKLATWSDWSRSARILVSLLRRRVMPYPSLKALRERRRLARQANDIGDAMEGHGAATSFFGTRAVPGMGQGGGDMGIRDMFKLVRVVTKGKSKKGKDKIKRAGSNAAAQVGLSSGDDEEDALQRQLAEDDWRTSTVKIMEDLADLHERLWPRRKPLQKQLLLAMPPEARKRIPPPLFDVPTDSEYAISLMSIRVARGESIIPASLRGGREHGRARRFIANLNANPAATKVTASEDLEWDVANPDQCIDDMRQEANEKEATANRERVAAQGGVEYRESDDAPLAAESPAEIGTLGRLKNRIEASAVDLLGRDKDDSNASLQSIGAPQTAPANHKATPGTLSLSSEEISFIPLLTSNPRLQIPLDRIQGVKKTRRTNGLRIRHLTEKGIEHEDVFRFVPNRDEIFGKLVGWGGKRWKKVP